MVNKSEFILFTRNNSHYNLKFSLSNILYIIERLRPVFKLNSLLKNIYLFFPERSFKPNPYISYRFRIMQINNNFKSQYSVSERARVALQLQETPEAGTESVGAGPEAVNLITNHNPILPVTGKAKKKNIQGGNASGSKGSNYNKPYKLTTVAKQQQLKSREVGQGKANLTNLKKEAGTAGTATEGYLQPLPIKLEAKLTKAQLKHFSRSRVPVAVPQRSSGGGESIQSLSVSPQSFSAKKDKPVQAGLAGASAKNSKIRVLMKINNYNKLSSLPVTNEKNLSNTEIVPPYAAERYPYGGLPQRCGAGVDNKLNNYSIIQLHKFESGISIKYTLLELNNLLNEIENLINIKNTLIAAIRKRKIENLVNFIKLSIIIKKNESDNAKKGHLPSSNFSALIDLGIRRIAQLLTLRRIQSVALLQERTARSRSASEATKLKTSAGSAPKITLARPQILSEKSVKYLRLKIKKINSGSSRRASAAYHKYLRELGLLPDSARATQRALLQSRLAESKSAELGTKKKSLLAVPLRCVAAAPSESEGGRPGQVSGGMVKDNIIKIEKSMNLILPTLPASQGKKKIKIEISMSSTAAGPVLTHTVKNVRKGGQHPLLALRRGSVAGSTSNPTVQPLRSSGALTSQAGAPILRKDLQHGIKQSERSSLAVKVWQASNTQQPVRLNAKNSLWSSLSVALPLRRTTLHHSLSSKKNLQRLKDVAFRGEQRLSLIRKNITKFEAKKDILNENSNPVRLLYFNDNLKKPIINQYLKSMSTYNMITNGTILYYSSIIGFNFKKKIRAYLPFFKPVSLSINSSSKSSLAKGQLQAKLHDAGALPLLMSSMLRTQSSQGESSKGNEGLLIKSVRSAERLTSPYSLRGIRKVGGSLDKGKFSIFGRGIENNKLINNIYKFLYLSFKSMYCLISKPVFIIKSNKIIIQLFYFLLIPKIFKHMKNKSDYKPTNKKEIY
jgi:hypothetical protein